MGRAAWKQQGSNARLTSGAPHALAPTAAADCLLRVRSCAAQHTAGCTPAQPCKPAQLAASARRLTICSVCGSSALRLKSRSPMVRDTLSAPLMRLSRTKPPACGRAAGAAGSERVGARLCFPPPASPFTSVHKTQAGLRATVLARCRRIWWPFNGVIALIGGCWLLHSPAAQALLKAPITSAHLDNALGLLKQDGLVVQRERPRLPALGQHAARVACSRVAEVQEPKAVSSLTRLPTTPELQPAAVQPSRQHGHCLPACHASQAATLPLYQHIDPQPSCNPRLCWPR